MLMETRVKLFTKWYYKQLEEKKYDKPTERAAEVIDGAEKDDLLKVEVRFEGRPKVLEASKISSARDMVYGLRKDKPYDSEKKDDDSE